MSQITLPESDIALEHNADEFRQALIDGLSRTEKQVPCKFLYDAVGSELFEAICAAPEYYPTRTEVSILKDCAEPIRAAVGRNALIVEPGSGSSLKSSLLLNDLDEPAGYVPVEISETQLNIAAAELQEQFPELPIFPVCGDYTHGLPIPEIDAPYARKVLFFPGSTIGNFEPEARLRFLQSLASACEPGDGLILGVDLKKDPDRLTAAYNDAKGVTASFNLNLLARANRELGAQFDLSKFRHHAFFNSARGRVEMHLISLEDQRIRVGDAAIELEEHDDITTEYSYKFTVPQFARFARTAGFHVEQVWTDPERLFSVQFLVLDSDADSAS